MTRIITSYFAVFIFLVFYHQRVNSVLTIFVTVITVSCINFIIIRNRKMPMFYTNCNRNMYMYIFGTNNILIVIFVCSVNFMYNPFLFHHPIVVVDSRLYV